MNAMVEVIAYGKYTVENIYPDNSTKKEKETSFNDVCHTLTLLERKKIKIKTNNK